MPGKRTVRLFSDGSVFDSSPSGDLCTSIYVFDSAEQMNECCSCKVTRNGILSLSLNTNLTSNVLTGATPKRGVVKVICSLPVAGICDLTATTPQPGLTGWLTHVQKGTGTGFGQTEEELTDSFYSGPEAADLPEDSRS
jgi:hypothetical protein